MADSKLSVTVGVETAVHDMASRFAKHVHEEYGLRLKEVRFTWTVVTSIEGNDNSHLNTVEILSERST